MAAALAWCALLIGVRWHRTGLVTYAFLGWNLFLAALPLIGSTFFAWKSRSRAARVLQFPAFAFWLLFFPNAPYLLTDLIHLSPKAPVPLWYDLVLLLSCAGAGLALGYFSLHQVHTAIARRWGRLLGWLFVPAVLFLSGFGIYLGRFLRWNSWDLLTRPGDLLADIAHRLLAPWDHPHTFLITAAFGTLLTLGYLTLHSLTAATTPAPARTRQD